MPAIVNRSGKGSARKYTDVSLPMKGGAFLGGISVTTVVELSILRWISERYTVCIKKPF